MKNTLKIAVFILVILLSTLTQAQEIKIKAELDSAIILIGDQVKLHLEIEYPNYVDVLFPIPNDSIAQSVEIVERLSLDTFLLENNRQILSQDFIVTSFDTGHHVIPEQNFILNYNGRTDSVNSNATMLHVYTIPKLDSIMNALKGPLDIKPPYEAPITFKEVAPWILGSILFAGLLFLVLYAIKRKKNNHPIFSFPQKPKEPAHIIALRKLEQIKAEKIWQQDKIKEYYIELSDTLREYLENRFNIRAMEQTTEETIASIKVQNGLMDERNFENLKRILTNSDLVKFAKYKPLPDDNNMVLVDTFFFVEQTKIEIREEIKENTDDREGDDVILK